MNSQDDYIIRGIQAVQQEQYDVVETKPGEYAIKITGASAGEGYVCKFPKREGREYMQKARAERLVKAVTSVKKLKNAVDILLSRDSRRDLIDLRAGILSLMMDRPLDEISEAMRPLNVLIETLDEGEN